MDRAASWNVTVRMARRVTRCLVDVSADLVGSVQDAPLVTVSINYSTTCMYVHTDDTSSAFKTFSDTYLLTYLRIVGSTSGLMHSVVDVL